MNKPRRGRRLKPRLELIIKRQVGHSFLFHPNRDPRNLLVQSRTGCGNACSGVGAAGCRSHARTNCHRSNSSGPGQNDTVCPQLGSVLLQSLHSGVKMTLRTETELPDTIRLDDRDLLILRRRPQIKPDIFRPGWRSRFANYDVRGAAACNQKRRQQSNGSERLESGLFHDRCGPRIEP